MHSAIHLHKPVQRMRTQQCRVHSSGDESPFPFIGTASMVRTPHHQRYVSNNIKRIKMLCHVTSTAIYNMYLWACCTFHIFQWQIELSKTNNNGKSTQLVCCIWTNKGFTFSVGHKSEITKQSVTYPSSQFNSTAGTSDAFYCDFYSCCNAYDSLYH